MNEVSMSGSDTIIIDERVLTGLADNDCVGLSYPDNLMTVKIGKNGNAIYTINESGKRVQVVIRLLRGCSDDKYLNNKLTQMLANPAAFVLMTGEFKKKIGNGKGKVTEDTYILAGGVFTKNVDAKNNVEGDVEAALSIYTLEFAKAPRAIG
ncbi:hypothetical protein phi1422_0056 [Bdellovibrio phage phi1422]|uniref:hypothetical protein n=1 Tax=Bdellovibrio phage phi1422 TaxID=1127515 RepID=UPI0002536D6C|nr:hypothetical protein F395_gp56 [Bdellovibrio phage phi1422]AFC22576.1 hypothetical protein phi1422_0056 [Bdellovibrio phage phi1422]